jgi:tetratricopeptide (TPR) repeat protein
MEALMTRMLAFLAVLSALSCNSSQSQPATEVAPPLPELRRGVGSPSEPTDAMLRLGRAMSEMRGDSLSRAGKMTLDSVIALDPGDPDARVLRATFALCGNQRADLDGALADVDSALLHVSPTSPTRLGMSLQDVYSLKAKIELAMGHDREALALIERAIRCDPGDAEDIFNSGTVDPDSATIACNWRKVTLNALVSRNMADYRAYLARGLYYGFFKRFNSASQAKALQDLLTARKLAPSSALCRYLLGREYSSGGLTLVGQLSGRASASAKQMAMQEFTGAIALDRTFAPAYAQRAEMRYNLKQYTLAIKDYDAVIALEPKNTGAFNDRGLAKKYLGNNWGAVDDFSEAARLKGAGDWTIQFTLQSRAECNAAMEQYADAADDMTESLRAHLSSVAAGMGHARLRALFPECSDLADDQFLRMVHGAFSPAMTYSMFKTLAEDSLLGQLESTVVPSAYVQRGDYYLRGGDMRRAFADYARARRAYPSSIAYTERWRLAFESDAQEYYVDSQAEWPSEDVSRQTIWVKKQEKRAWAGYSMERIAIDCRGQTIRLESATSYRADGSVVASSDHGALPASIVPGSVGEWFSKALCR